MYVRVHVKMLLYCDCKLAADWIIADQHVLRIKGIVAGVQRYIL
jgi:hypothetical protein